MPPVIRRIKKSDVVGFHRVVDTVARERRYLPELEAPPIASTVEFVQKIIDTKQSKFVAVSDDVVVGWCGVLTRSEAVRTHIGVVGMGLLPDFRGSGLGFEMLATTLSDAKRKGLSRIELKVRASNTRAIRLYESLGFVHEGILKDDVLLDGQFDSTCCMALFPSEELAGNT